MATSSAVAAKPAAAPAPVPQAPADPLTGYYRSVRQMNLQLAKERYKQGFKVRTQEYIRGRGTLAVVDEEICMGCTHCFDNCAFESIGMVDRKFALPDYSYTSRKAIIIEENCVGCEKCAIVCPVDAITMVTKHGFEVKDGRVVSTTPPAPPAPKPPAATPTTARPTAAAPPPKPAAPAPVVKPAAAPPPTEAPAPKTPPKPEPKAEEESAEPADSSEEPTEEEAPDEEGDG
jgi:NAD-dependent dihydropyrimidine dehydrogenase PreA subunit